MILWHLKIRKKKRYPRVSRRFSWCFHLCFAHTFCHFSFSTHFSLIIWLAEFCFPTFCIHPVNNNFKLPIYLYSLGRSYNVSFEPMIYKIHYKKYYKNRFFSVLFHKIFICPFHNFRDEKQYFPLKNKNKRKHKK